MGHIGIQQAGQMCRKGLAIKPKGVLIALVACYIAYPRQIGQATQLRRYRTGVGFAPRPVRLHHIGMPTCPPDVRTTFPFGSDVGNHDFGSLVRFVGMPLDTHAQMLGGLGIIAHLGRRGGALVDLTAEGITPTQLGQLPRISNLLGR